MLKEMLKERGLPEYKSREEMLEILQREEYGYMPKAPEEVSWKEENDFIPNFCAGKAECRRVEITSRIDGKEFTFPVYATIPKKEGKHPYFICINFRPDVPDRYVPTEEIIDNGFAVLSFCINDVTGDNGDFTDGLAGILYPDGVRTESSPGKIAMWAWAAQRVMDYAQSIDSLDTEGAAVCGHSRLGKTALLTAATDTRFRFAWSNDSGCCGAAITRGGTGESVEVITRVFPYWFCEKFAAYANREDDMPFDQHWLTASVAPRYVYIASAAEDLWADPVSEMLNCVAVDEVYKKLGKDGFIYEDKLPEIGDEYHGGHVGYHMRSGLHYLSREDWQRAMRFVKKHYAGI